MQEKKTVISQWPFLLGQWGPYSPHPSILCRASGALIHRTQASCAGPVEPLFTAPKHPVQGQWGPYSPHPSILCRASGALIPRTQASCAGPVGPLLAAPKHPVEGQWGPYSPHPIILCRASGALIPRTQESCAGPVVLIFPGVEGKRAPSDCKGGKGCVCNIYNPSSREIYESN